MVLKNISLNLSSLYESCIVYCFYLYEQVEYNIKYGVRIRWWIKDDLLLCKPLNDIYIYNYINSYKKKWFRCSQFTVSKGRRHNTTTVSMCWDEGCVWQKVSGGERVWEVFKSCIVECPVPEASVIFVIRFKCFFNIASTMR